MRVAAWVFNIIVVFGISSLTVGTLAEPISPDPKVNKPHGESDEGPPQSIAPLRPMNVSLPPDEPLSASETYFYPYQSGISLNVGPYFMEDTAPHTIIYGLLGLNYLWYSPYLVHLETGVETITSGEGHLWTMARFQSNATHIWRPFFGVGLGVRIIPQNGLATFLQLADYFPRLSLGAEYGIFGRRSWRMEAAAAADFQGHPFVVLTVGYSLGI